MACKQYVAYFTALSIFSLFVNSVCALTSQPIEESYVPGLRDNNSTAKLGPPREFMVYSLNSTSVFANWTAPKASDNVVVDGYHIQYFIDSDEEEDEEPKTCYTKNTSVEINYLSGCTYYNFSVQAVSTDEELGDPETAVEETGLEGGPPRVGYFDDEVGPSNATLMWSPPKTNCTISNYTLEGTGTVLWGNQTDHIVEPITLPGNETSYNAEELIPMTDYTFSIFAMTDGGKGNISDHLFTTEEDVPSEPLEFEPDILSTSDVLLTWKPPEKENGFPTYLIQITDDLSDETSDTYYLIRNLVACMEYTAVLSAKTTAGVGESVSINFKMDPEVPPPTTFKSCTALSATTIQLEWLKPNTTCQIEEYRMSARGKILDLNNKEIVSNAVTSSCCSYQFQDLVPNTAYTFAFVYVTEGGLGTSDTCSVTTKEDVPGTPLKLTASEIRKHSFTVTWKAPLIKNGKLKGFNVLLTSEIDSKFVKADEDPLHVYSFSFDYLLGHTSYQVNVTATTGAGPGEAATLDVLTGGHPAAAGVGVALSFIVVFIIAAAIYMHRRNLRSALGKMSPVHYSEGEGVTTSTAPIPLNQLAAHVRKLQNENALADEFGYLVTQTSARRSTREAEKIENQRKNRYSNILPYDNTRVSLRGGSSRYINANHVNSSHHTKFFIAAQGPLINTLEDFWNMIWYEKVDIIVMLAQCFEHGKDMCTQYWPRSLEFGTDLGHFSIHNISEEATSLFIVRTLEVTHRTSNTKKLITQFHFTAWPDFGAPYKGDELLRLISTVKRNMKRDTSKILVHCSAGVGRTGTFIALWNIIERIDGGEQTVSILREVMNLRWQRMNMVQSKDQYIYLYKSVLEYVENIAKWQVLMQGSTQTNDGRDQTGAEYPQNSVVFDNLSFEPNQEFEGNLI